MTTCTSSSCTQSSSDRGEEKESLPQELTSGKRKPKWIQETLKEAQESMGNPKKVFMESKLS